MAGRLLRATLAAAAVVLAACAAPAPPNNDQVPASARETWEIAEAGDPVAQTVLGTMFEAGVFGRPDYRAAAQWYDRAVKQDDPLAAFYLGNLFERGTGVGQDYVAAANLYRRAAQSGNASAAFKLAFLYEKGLGVAQDFTQARAWYDKAQEGWVMQGLEPMQPAYLVADASAEEVEALIAAAAASQGGSSGQVAVEVNPPEIALAPPAPAPEPEAEPVVASQAATQPVAAESSETALAMADFSRAYHVHLASEKSVEAALADWQSLRTRFPDLLQGLTPALATLDLGAGGIYYQLLAGPIGDEASADILCARLQPQGQYCTPLMPKG